MKFSILVAVCMLGFCNTATGECIPDFKSPCEEFTDLQQEYTFNRTTDGMLVGWYNFKTGKTEIFSDDPPANRMNEFIPQTPDAQGLYKFSIGRGNTPKEAALFVFLLTVEKMGKY